MSVLLDLTVAMQSNLPFSTAWRRLRCMRDRHAKDDSKTIETARFEKHPHSDSCWVYTANLKCCSHCGLEYLDTGIELRDWKEMRK